MRIRSVRERGIDHARAVARSLVVRWGVRGAGDVNLEGWCERRGIKILVGRVDGANAELIRAIDRATIMLSDRVKDPAMRRFIIAHELGHYFLEHPTPAADRLCEPTPSRSIDETVHDFEAEASAFAGEILLPYILVGERCNRPIDLHVVRDLAREYRVSILTAAIQVASVSRERCAAVFSDRGEIKWVATSRSFGHDIARNAPVPARSLASTFFQRGHLDEHPISLPAQTWVRCSSPSRLVEHSTASHEFQTVLSMLWIPRPDSVTARHVGAELV